MPVFAAPCACALPRFRDGKMRMNGHGFHATGITDAGYRRLPAKPRPKDLYPRSLIAAHALHVPLPAKQKIIK